MDVIIHQAVTPYIYSFLSTVVTEDLEIKSLVIFAEKDSLSPVASLDDMMRTARYNNSCYSSHYIVFDGQQKRYFSK
jgi:hypothetical protein